MKIIPLCVGLLMAGSVCAENIDATNLRTYGENENTLIYVFTSPTCPHCATYQKEILPVLKQEYADKNLAQVKVVDMPGDKKALRAIQLGRCMTGEQYAKYADAVYQNQAIWAYAKNPDDILKGYATESGMPAKAQQRCLMNAKLTKSIIAQSGNLSQMYHITGLPSTVVVKGLQSKTIVGSGDTVLSDIQKAVK